jgi:hypothetical protein
VRLVRGRGAVSLVHPVQGSEDYVRERDFFGTRVCSVMMRCDHAVLLLRL